MDNLLLQHIIIERIIIFSIKYKKKKISKL